eukprot:CAMPEP_0117679912 /NCGR_PEP_ID=MMETSP0804-20121206/18060_1 /TAXON_ID=1074897 /ORGANISM="Tetraselmis astigmatica, Strain CCMP880" /LENGTH=148 /DNA_ID=CAMNT_0005489351 /DNA_START=775 /DNA_END=1219 /DNA_ORIENTATION=-
MRALPPITGLAIAGEVHRYSVDAMPLQDQERAKVDPGLDREAGAVQKHHRNAIVGPLVDLHERTSCPAMVAVVRAGRDPESSPLLRRRGEKAAHLATSSSAVQITALRKDIPSPGKLDRQPCTDTLQSRLANRSGDSPLDALQDVSLW